jgi:hypothetical protein
MIMKRWKLYLVELAIPFEIKSENGQDATLNEVNSFWLLKYYNITKFLQRKFELVSKKVNFSKSNLRR